MAEIDELDSLFLLNQGNSFVATAKIVTHSIHLKLNIYPFHFFRYDVNQSVRKA
jgi:hypothetical protein